MDEEVRLRLVGAVSKAVDGCWLELYSSVRAAGWDKDNALVQRALERMVTDPALPFQPAQRQPLNTLRVADVPALSSLPPAALRLALFALVPHLGTPQTRQQSALLPRPGSFWADGALETGRAWG